MAPSRSKIRSDSAWCIASMRCLRSIVSSSGSRLLRTHTERVTNGEGQLGAVQRIEMKLLDTLLLQQSYLFYRDAGCNELACLGIVLQSVEASG